MTELYTPTQTTLDDLRGSGYTVIDDVDRAGVTNLLMNTGRGPLEDRDVREAIVSAIDREEFRDVVLDASYEVADQPFPSDSQWHADVNYPEHDPDRARELVSAYESVNGPITISIMLVAGGPPAAPQFIEQELEEVGIDTQIEELEVTAYTQRFVTGAFDTALLGGFFFAQDPDPSTMFLTSKNADPDAAIKLNFSELRSDEIDAALDAQRRTGDDAARRAEWAKVWNVLATELPYAFLVYQRFALVTSPDVHGITGFTTPDGAAVPPINHWTTFYTGVYRSGA